MQRERERLTLLEERCEITEEGGLPQGGGETQGGGKCEWVNDSIVPLVQYLAASPPPQSQYWDRHASHICTHREHSHYTPAVCVADSRQCLTVSMCLHYVNKLTG